MVTHYASQSYSTVSTDSIIDERTVLQSGVLMSVDWISLLLLLHSFWWSFACSSLAICLSHTPSILSFLQLPSSLPISFVLPNSLLSSPVLSLYFHPHHLSPTLSLSILSPTSTTHSIKHHAIGEPACFCHLMTRTCWGHSHGIQHLQDVLTDRKKNAPVVSLLCASLPTHVKSVSLPATHTFSSLSLPHSHSLFADHNISLSFIPLSTHQGSYTKRLFEDPDLLQKKLLEEVSQ